MEEINELLITLAENSIKIRTQANPHQQVAILDPILRMADYIASNEIEPSDPYLQKQNAYLKELLTTI